MDKSDTFERYEIKFILDPKERHDLLKLMDGKMKIDKYGRTTIRNIYYDTDDHRMIRNSLDKPEYKEKLRVRSYSRITGDDLVFVELKKKYDSIVYKRRIAIPESEACDWLIYGNVPVKRTQIMNEIEYVRNFYEGIKPKVFLSYEREAYYPLDDTDLRITLDSNIIAREHDLSLLSGVSGDNVIPRDLTVLEIKVPHSIPMWLTAFLNRNDIHKTSFSKYGTYYINMMSPAKDKKGELLYA